MCMGYEVKYTVDRCGIMIAEKCRRSLTLKQGNPSCENSEANSVLMLSDSLPHALNIHTHSIMIEEMFYKMADW